MKKIPIEKAVKKRYPEGVALIVCQNKQGRINVTPVDWFMICNLKPRYWAVSLYNKHYSYKIISEQKEFVLCIPSYSQKKDLLYCGKVSGWKTDKMKNCQFATIPAKKIKPPLIQDSIACFECVLTNKHRVIDHTIFIGKIVAAYVSDRTDKIYNRGEEELFLWKLDRFLYKI